MKEAGSPKLFENLDLTPIQSNLWTNLHRDGPGRPVEYNPEWDLKALMLRQLEQIPYVKDLVKRLRRNPYLRRACGYGDRAPCEAHFTQMKKRIGVEGFRIKRPGSEERPSGYADPSHCQPSASSKPPASTERTSPRGAAGTPATPGGA